MKKSRTGSPAGEALASPPVATVQLPLPLLDVLADTRTAFFGLCLDAGQQVLRTMMEQDRARLCGPKNRIRSANRVADGGALLGYPVSRCGRSRASVAARNGLAASRR